MPQQDQPADQQPQPQEEYEVLNGAPELDKQLKFISIHDICHPSYEDTCEDKAIVGCLISIKHRSSAGDGKTAGASWMQKAGSPYQRMRTSGPGTVTYDRLFTFADLRSTNGKCFCVMTSNPQESDKLMRHCISNVRVGDTFVIIEPDSIKNYMGRSDNPIISFRQPLFPVRLKKELPKIKLSVPDMGQQKFFCLTGQDNIKFQRALPVQASCSGFLCDRQQDLSLHEHCGCLIRDRSKAIVLCMDVTLPISLDDVTSYRVQNFRSWRTTMLFFSTPLTPSTELSSLIKKHREIRTKIKDIQNYINGNGGWTVIGWYHKGQVLDASADTKNQEDNITSQNHSIHISYLYPTSITPDQIKAMQYKHEQPENQQA